MNRRQFILSTTGVVGASTVGGVAFTSATVTRDVNIGVDADDAAIIGLNPGVGTELDGDVLKINGTSTALNPEGSFTFGDSNDPTNTYAFSITNNSGEQQTLTFTFSLDSRSDNADVTFDIFDDSGSSLGTVSDGGSLDITSLGGASTVYVVFTANTDSTTDLSGSVTISA
jgi:hypothetical protein